MIKAIILSMGLAASSGSLSAPAQNGRGYSYGPVTEIDRIHVEYGRFDEYMAWVTSTWKPTMEAAKKAGLIIGYNVVQSEPKSPAEPNMFLEITYKNMGAYAGNIGDQADAFEAVTEKVICSSACQDQARVNRNEIRKVLGYQLAREIVFPRTAAAQQTSEARATKASEASPQNKRGFSYGPVTTLGYNQVKYGRFDDYMKWVGSTWVPTMEAAEKAGLIIGYKILQLEPKSPDEPNLYLEITYKNMAAYAGSIGDQADAFEAVADKVICSSACQDQARVNRNELRTFQGTEVTREIVFNK